MVRISHWFVYAIERSVWTPWLLLGWERNIFSTMRKSNALFILSTEFERWLFFLAVWLVGTEDTLKDGTPREALVHAGTAAITTPRVAPSLHSMSHGRQCICQLGLSKSKVDFFSGWSRCPTKAAKSLFAQDLSCHGMHSSPCVWFCTLFTQSQLFGSLCIDIFPVSNIQTIEFPSSSCKWS